jgi:hypothetical protein
MTSDSVTSPNNQKAVTSDSRKAMTSPYSRTTYTADYETRDRKSTNSSG